MLLPLSSLLSPVSKSSITMCHVSKLSNLLLSLLSLQQVSSCFAMYHVSELTNLFLPLPFL
jgi:hypothetical protein